MQCFDYWTCSFPSEHSSSPPHGSPGNRLGWCLQQTWVLANGCKTATTRTIPLWPEVNTLEDKPIWEKRKNKPSKTEAEWPRNFILNKLVWNYWIFWEGVRTSSRSPAVVIKYPWVWENKEFIPVTHKVNGVYASKPCFSHNSLTYCFVFWTIWPHYMFHNVVPLTWQDFTQ